MDGINVDSWLDVDGPGMSDTSGPFIVTYRFKSACIIPFVAVQADGESGGHSMSPTGG